jgi:hypothetical protein
MTLPKATPRRVSSALRLARIEADQERHERELGDLRLRIADHAARLDRLSAELAARLIARMGEASREPRVD